MKQLHEYTIHASALPLLRKIATQHENRHIRQRAHVLLLLHVGQTPAKVAFDFDILESTILEWWRCWEHEGMAWLYAVQA